MRLNSVTIEGTFKNHLEGHHKQLWHRKYQAWSLKFIIHCKIESYIWVYFTVFHSKLFASILPQIWSAVSVIAEEKTAWKLKNRSNPSQNFPSTFPSHLIHLRKTVSQKTVWWMWSRGGQTFHISTDLLHCRHPASVGGYGSSLIKASLQCTWLTVCHTAGLNGPRNIIHRYVMGYAHKSLRLAELPPGTYGKGCV